MAKKAVATLRSLDKTYSKIIRRTIELFHNHYGRAFLCLYNRT